MPQSRFHHFQFLPSILVLLLVGIAAISLTFSIQSFQSVEKTIRTSSFQAFNNSIEASYDIVDTALNESIKRYLRGIVVSSAKFITQIQKSTSLTSVQKTALIQDYINSNKIGDTGYSYILNSKGKLEYHPIFQGRNVSEYRHIQEQIDNDDHFVEYLWMNPNEEKPRKKLAYSIYVEELDFIVSASAYKDELLHFINKTILKDKLNKYQYGDTGYVYVINLTGELILHPSYEGENIRSLIGESADGLLHKIQQSANRYSLQMNIVNGMSETTAHAANIEDYSYQITLDGSTYQKDVLYIYYPYLDWAIVSGISRDELNRPTNTLLYSLSGLLFSLVSIIGILLILLNQRHKKLTHVLNRDYLTGLLNRHAFHNMVTPLISEQHHPTVFSSYSITLLDIDFFKHINDTYGQIVGDKIITIVGKAISQYPNVLAARYDGEVFIFFISENRPKRVIEFTEKVRQQINKYNTLNEAITLSAGITTISKPNILLDDVIEQADKALRHSKDTGRDKITHYRDL
jgi:diguanylate cyclase (GGDEF)-like protein